MQKRSPLGAEVTNIATSRPGGSVTAESNLFSSAALGFNAAVDNGVSVPEREASPSHLESSSSSPSHLPLYDYLVDVIGEGLTLSLSVTAHEGEGGRDPRIKPHPLNPELPKVDTATRTSHALEVSLSREGFRPIRVQLPRRAAPPPSIPMGYYKGRLPWTFHIPQPLMPMTANVLEQKQLQRSTHGPKTQAVCKGRCSGHHRYYRHQSSANISSYWV